MGRKAIQIEMDKKGLDPRKPYTSSDIGEDGLINPNKNLVSALVENKEKENKQEEMPAKDFDKHLEEVAGTNIDKQILNDLVRLEETINKNEEEDLDKIFDDLSIEEEEKKYKILTKTKIKNRVKKYAEKGGIFLLEKKQKEIEDEVKQFEEKYGFESIKLKTKMKGKKFNTTNEILYWASRWDERSAILRRKNYLVMLERNPKVL